MAVAQVRALEHRPAAADAEGAPGRRPDDAVRRQPVTALEALDGPRRPGSEDAVGGDAEPALEQADRGAARRHAGRRARAARDRVPAVDAATDHAPGRRADDPVGVQAVAALE